MLNIKSIKRGDPFIVSSFGNGNELIAIASADTVAGETIVLRRREFGKVMLKDNRIRICMILWFLQGAIASASALPKGFVYVDNTIANVRLEIRYSTQHNFVGETIDGYRAPQAILSVEAAEALRTVQQKLSDFGLGLLIFDAYRPQQAVDHFVRWAENLDDTRMKQEFYPNVKKKNLFREEYIAARSSHTRGSTVDLTIVNLQDGEALDMGSAFDFFGRESWPDYPDLTAAQHAHRMLLHEIMVTHGFKPYPKEWWHFTLANEPYPDTYFNFPVE